MSSRSPSASAPTPPAAPPRGRTAGRGCSADRASLSTPPGPQDDGLLGPAAIRELAQQLELRPTKTLGQNFLHDANTIRRIVRTADLRNDDVVLEVGPGLGSLTLGLLPAAAHVVAVEIDPRLAALLPTTVAERRPDLADRLTVVEADALRITELPGPPPTALVANLPYNVAVPVLLHLLDLAADPATAPWSWCRPRWPTGWPRRREALPTACRRSRPPGTARCAGPATSDGGCSGPSRTSTPAWWPSSGGPRRRATGPATFAVDRRRVRHAPQGPARGAGALGRQPGRRRDPAARRGHRAHHAGRAAVGHRLRAAGRDRPGAAVTPAVTARAPAKVNVHLAVGPLRADGFHELRTVYLAVSLFDTVTVRPADGLSLTVSGEGTGPEAGRRRPGRPPQPRLAGGRAAGRARRCAGRRGDRRRQDRSRPRPGWPGAAPTRRLPWSPWTRSGARGRAAADLGRPGRASWAATCRSASTAGWRWAPGGASSSRRCWPARAGTGFSASRGRGCPPPRSTRSWTGCGPTARCRTARRLASAEPVIAALRSGPPEALAAALLERPPGRPLWLCGPSCGGRCARRPTPGAAGSPGQRLRSDGRGPGRRRARGDPAGGDARRRGRVPHRPRRARARAGRPPGDLKGLRPHRSQLAAGPAGGPRSATRSGCGSRWARPL